MKKVYVALGEPTVDMPVMGRDAAGGSAKILAVFKRYDAKKTQELLDKILPLSLNIEKEDNFKLAMGILRMEIVALKGVTLYDAETGEVEKEIPDTRLLVGKISPDNNAVLKDEPAPWELGSSACLEFLLDLYLATPAWGAAFVSAFYALHNNNTSYIEDLTGN